MRNKNVITNIKYIHKENSYDRRYYTAILKYNYLNFLISGKNDNEEKKINEIEPYKIHSVIINGKEFHEDKGELKQFADTLRKTEGNIWVLDITIPKREYMYKLLGNNRSTNTITKAFNKFLGVIELSPCIVSWMCSVQYNTDEMRLYFLFFENEPSIFNQRINEYCYRKGRVDLECLDYFKSELLRGISHLKNTLDYDSLKDMYLGLVQF